MGNIDRFQLLLREERSLVMGVLNVTPDSFSDAGQFLQTEDAVSRAIEMLDEGADIIDIGGQSTRPPGNAYGKGAEPVSLPEELERVIPVIEQIISQRPEAIISIDTVKSEVASRAIAAGATIINDVSAGTEDAEMFIATKKIDAPIILMHGYGPEFSKSRIEEYHYGNVIEDVFLWLRNRIDAAREIGITTILADIGFGFAKKPEDNITLLRGHKKFTELGVPMVLGASRKSTIGKLLGGVPPSDRLSGSIVAAVYGVLNGAKIIRTHDVKQTLDALKVTDAIVRS
jgi:dihydropteroate synthase